MAGAMAALLALLVGMLFYWQVVAHERLANDPHNRRGQWRQEKIQRGAIYDRAGRPLAESVFVAGRQVRRYPLGRASAHVVGYSSARYGRSGLEARYQAPLSGLAVATALTELRNELLGRRAHGADVFTTLDGTLQQAAWKALRGRRGAVVALSADTGAVRCLVSSPAFDPARLDDEWKTLVVSADRPLFDRALQGRYPPGSTFKVVTAAAALEYGVASDSTRFHCSGTRRLDHYTIHCEHTRAHGDLDLTRALVVSCNCTFGLLATQVGAPRLEAMAHRFGFGQRLRLELPVRVSQIRNPGQTWFLTLVAQTGFGQGQVVVTPWQMSLVAATIANGGIRPNPFLVKSVRNYEGQVIEQRRSVPGPRVVSTATAARLADMMTAVVKTGSTRRVFRGLGVQVAGKTGTAQNPHPGAHAWFIAFVPLAGRPLAVAVVVENAGAGSRVAAPIARDLIAAWVRTSARTTHAGNAPRR